ncbi:IS3 family transposase, partial [Corynebacterium diphtheriae]|uniref:IS3 family transposase n=1 Tax=Corynebacterium diphtheriae TaxID=1717 RepID=UPI0015E751D3
MACAAQQQHDRQQEGGSKAHARARSTFFDHQRRFDLPDKYADLKTQIKKIFHDSNATFGYRRIWRALRNNNTIVNKKVVRRLMR